MTCRKLTYYNTAELKTVYVKKELTSNKSSLDARSNLLFGMIMPGRSYNSSDYRFGFGGHEKVDEVTGVTGAHVDMGDRWLDTRIGRTPKPDRKAVNIHIFLRTLMQLTVLYYL